MFKAPLLSKIYVASLAIVFFVAAPLSAQNIVVNPGFESGDFSPGWTFTPSVFGSLTVVDFNNPHTGTYELKGAQFDDFDSISQNLTTVAGKSYDLSFWLSSADEQAGGTTLEVRVWWNGAIVLDRTGDPHEFPYTQVFLSNLVATSSSTELRFDIRNDPGIYYLDDISVIATQRLKTITKSGTTATITMDSITGYSYQLQRSDTLLPGTFANLGIPQTGTGGVLTFVDSSATTPSAFYRVLISIGSQANPGPLQPVRRDAKVSKVNAAKWAERLRAKYQYSGKPNR
jgi:hypothetical protein